MWKSGLQTLFHIGNSKEKNKNLNDVLPAVRSLIDRVKRYKMYERFGLNGEE